MKQEHISSIKQLVAGMKAERAELDKRIVMAENLLGLSIAPSSNGTTKKPVKQAFKGKGFVQQLLPVMELGKAYHVADLLKQLHKQPGMRNVTRESFESTLNSELRKGDRSRLLRSAPGYYTTRPEAATPHKGGAVPEIQATEPDLQLNIA